MTHGHAIAIAVIWVVVCAVLFVLFDAFVLRPRQRRGNRPPFEWPAQYHEQTGTEEMEKDYSEYRATCVFCGGFGVGGTDSGGTFQSGGRCYHCDGTGWVYAK